MMLARIGGWNIAHMPVLGSDNLLSEVYKKTIESMPADIFAGMFFIDVKI